MTTVAYDVLWPCDEILVRVAFLYVGQGASAVIFIADGESSFKVLLVDINTDKRADGIDVPAMMSDLLGEKPLDIFINTHPHDDHLCGISELSEIVDIHNVWHSGYEPGGKDQKRYEELMSLIQKVEQDGGEVREIIGSRSAEIIGEAQLQVLSPAEHVKAEIAEQKPTERRKRIHEHCAALKFGLNDDWILIPGDADLIAWRDHIMYHKKHVGAEIFAAPHHGSRSFFIEKKEDKDPYLDAIKAVKPKKIIVSAPKRYLSRHKHPHKVAMDWYADQVGKDNVIHLGKEKRTVICDISRDGGITVEDDDKRLSAEYGLKRGKQVLKSAMMSDATHTQSEPNDSHAETTANKRWTRSICAKIEISTGVYDAKNGELLDVIENDGPDISEEFWLKFVAKVYLQTKIDYDIYWQVTNTGQQAKSEGGLRGEIFSAKDTPMKVDWEHTAYTGRHWVRCYAVTKNGVCIGESPKFYINVLNSDEQS